MHAGELQSAIVAMIGDESQTGHDLEQLRIFYNQAADEDALKSIGLSQVQPYLDRVDALASIEDLNALITDKDFPFMPFVQSTICTVGMQDKNVVKVEANLLFTDVELFGGQYYQDSDDEQTKQSNQAELLSNAIPLVTDLMAQGMSEEEAKSFAKHVLATETKYGKHVDYDARYSSLPYGAFAQASFDSVCTYDELIALFTNLPMEGMLDKLGKLGSERYKVTREWAQALNDLWTNENLEDLKSVVKATVLTETMPYRDQSGINEARVSLGAPPTDASQSAYEACDNLNTLSQVIAKLYVNNAIGQEGKARLEQLTHDLLDAYKELFEKTACPRGTSSLEDTCRGA
ncbi:MAG: hypothetical protein Q4A01_08115 [Coriobacteriales bacterium]|nr:hypothetical protein [Coriobacteriales bacterium]